MVAENPLIVKWHCHTSGRSDAPPVLFLHGFMGRGRVWLPIMEALGDAIFGLAPDLPGHGTTIADLANLTFDNLSKELVGLLAAQTDRPPIVVGYSMGGRIALHTVLAYPGKFAGLVLESSTAGIEDQAERTARLSRDETHSARMRTIPMPQFLREWYRQPIYRSLQSRPELLDAIIQKKASGDPAALAETIVRLSPGHQPSSWGKLDRFDRPVLLVAGELDEKYRDIAARMKRHLHQADLSIVPGAGHIVHLECRDRFIQLLKMFLASRIL